MPGGVTFAVNVVISPGNKLEYGDAVILTNGLGLTATVVDDDVFEQPLALVTTTE